MHKRITRALILSIKAQLARRIKEQSTVHVFICHYVAGCTESGWSMKTLENALAVDGISNCGCFEDIATAKGRDQNGVYYSAVETNRRRLEWLSRNGNRLIREDKIALKDELKRWS